ncbi:hypothetical protein SERLA73DRAFT_173161 [Serpula lacrymans var. lacrymans S7.3]|uniref:Cation/H+ exchanger transmembrane domain-containing protein n=2 Tax=Serpula lacrymans var. lacrymans TaxID=341189 RepID=F8QI20_SERL3|nr:uncharacterized protein SERLADRAFT_367548 [Serpula lacrymans var. lacrymans S7.9]EGN92031.1 hypothetical protein SERLA73DRAFT_173161 [Serpula lacrymans var. lacrymans S7.3]EGO27980.1 hypothetical protein SERLADRAFT_367548 [Serpula lacrymans var. lacrymans S7.9]
MGHFSKQLVEVPRNLLRRTAPEQAGLFAGLNPVDYNLKDPLPLWVIQVVIIIAMTQLLHMILGRIHQPRVIAEIIGGILLGPSVMGRIPGFQNAIFPSSSFPVLILTSTIGLVLFLFIVGMEIDARVVRHNMKSSMSISAAGLIVPLGLGAALGIPLYHQFVDESVNFGYFLLFTAVAVGITAFPVLCRILTECKLLDTTVGAVVLSAGVGNDVIGWVLLALAVALVNASTGLEALYVLLTGIGYTIFLLYPVRWCFVWLARRTGSLETGQPTTSMMTVTLLVVFISAFFTDVIGIHPIFGGFLAGLIIPHENGFSIAVVEKLEDLVSVLLLPLYFAFSGLQTNLGLLNDGITWGYMFLICVVAFFSKFLACGLAAKLTGFNNRESSAIGALMSCKGLVELIVLNVGLEAGILDTRTFSMFVLQAVILTFITTPLTLLAYPESVRVHTGTVTDKPKRSLQGGEESMVGSAAPTGNDEIKSRFAVILDKFEQLPAAMTFTQLIQSPSQATPTSSTSSEEQKAAIRQRPSPITVDALRLIELTDRTSAVLKSQAADFLIHNDPILGVFRTFGHLSRISVATVLAVVGYDDFSSSISKHALDSQSQMVVIPWSRIPAGTTPTEESGQSNTTHNPFDGIFHKSGSDDLTSSIVTSDYIRRVFATSPVDVALFVDRGVSAAAAFTPSASQHLFVPFFGGPDDRLALSFVVQVCMNPNVTATVIRTFVIPDTIYGANDTQTRLASATVDSLVWDHYTSKTDHPEGIASALKRISFHEERTPHPLHTILELASNETRRCSVSSRTLIVALGRSRRMATDSHHAELRQIAAENGSPLNGEVPKTFGDVGAAMVTVGINASLLVLQANIHS